MANEAREAAFRAWRSGPGLSELAETAEWLDEGRCDSPETAECLEGLAEKAHAAGYASALQGALTRVQAVADSEPVQGFISGAMHAGLGRAVTEIRRMVEEE